MPSKVIAPGGGYKTDRQGDVVGKGHATRDLVEWLLPPLWPWKMITLPARGPRPTFKGEEQLTLRLMDDVVVPKVGDLRPAPMPGWHYFGGQPAAQLQSDPQPSNYAQPASFVSVDESAVTDARHAQLVKRETLIALSTGEVFGVTSYRIEDGCLNYVLTGGAQGSAAVDEVDWTRTSELNTARASSGVFVARAY